MKNQHNTEPLASVCGTDRYIYLEYFHMFGCEKVLCAEYDCAAYGAGLV